MRIDLVGVHGRKAIIYQRHHGADTVGLAADEGLGAIERIDSGEDATVVPRAAAPSSATTDSRAAGS